MHVHTYVEVRRLVKELVLTSELRWQALYPPYGGLFVGSLLISTLTSRNYPMPAHTHKETPEELALSFST